MLDAFCGSAAVAYMYKTKGLQVTASDRLRFCHHMARAIIENSNTKLTEADIETVLSDNANAGTYVYDNYKQMYFHKGVHQRIDLIRANIENLKGYKRDIALFALGRACMQATDHGHFSSRKPDSRSIFNADEFDKAFRKFATKISMLVFDNGQENKALVGDIEKVLPQVQADLVYFDPPYATQFSAANYTAMYHFVEGLMTYWQGMELRKDTALKSFKTDDKGISAKTAPAFFETFLTAAQHFPVWLLSYRDKAFPNERQMKTLFQKLGRISRMRSKDHTYTQFNKGKTEANQPKERLFLVVKDGPKSQAEVELDQELTALAELPANFRTQLPVEVTLIQPDPLSTVANVQDPPSDPQFRCILCREGTNRNGDHFTRDELSQRYLTAINKKVDLQHGQEFDDIVGGIVDSDYLEDGQGGRVEVVGELYLNESKHGPLAYKMMKKGLVSQVSMECDYAEGECSICRQRVKSKKDYCVHLAKYKGRMFEGKPVFEILHGVTFSGLGLLDRKGADENAKIFQVGSATSEAEYRQQGAESMEGQKPWDEQSHAEKHSGGNGGSNQPSGGDQDLASQNKVLLEENKQLKRQVEELTRRLQEIEANQEAEARKARAAKLLAVYERKGGTFSSPDAREKELERLAGLSDEAFTAAEASFAIMPSVTKPASQPQNGKTMATAPESLNQEARIRPRDVDDTQDSLEEKLTRGFMTVYRERFGIQA